MEVLFASVPVVDFKAALPWYERVFGHVPDVVPNENEVLWRVAGDSDGNVIAWIEVATSE